MFCKKKTHDALVDQIKSLTSDKSDLEDKLKQVENKKIINSISDLEQIILLAKKHRVDLIEVEGHKVVVSRHDYPVDTSIKHPDAGKSQEELDEEILFHSSGI